MSEYERFDRRGRDAVRGLKANVARRAARSLRPPPIAPAMRRESPPPERESADALRERRRASLALSNLRGLTIVFVLMMHANLAYLATAPARPAPFGAPPNAWVVFPIVDRSRWLGLDIFCAWQDVYLMALMFFLSGLFAFSSVERDGPLKFLGRRSVRLGAPLAFGVVALMPVALYPVYRLGANEPSLADYFDKYLALPFAPAGPLWFLGALLVLTAIAAVLWRFLRPAIIFCGRLSLAFDARPARALSIWVLVTVVAYAPLALAFTPWRWENWGPFAIQLCRIALYAVYFGAGAAVGAVGLGAGLLRADGAVARTWGRWAATAALSLVLWMGLTGLTIKFGEASPFVLRLASDASFALACACSALFFLAFSLRFGAAGPWPLLGRLSDDAYGVYVVHYAPVVWLQFALLNVNEPAPVKALIVLVGAGAASLALLFAGRAAMSVARRQWAAPAIPTSRSAETL